MNERMATDDAGNKTIDVASLVREISGLATQFEVLRFLKRLTAQMGLKGFIVLKMPVSTSRDFSSLSIISNWSADFVSTCDKSHQIIDNPLIQRAQVSTVPFAYDLEAMLGGGGDESAPPALAPFIHAGLGKGAVMPVADAHGGRGIIMVSGAAHEPSTDELLLLHLIATHVYDRLFQIRQLDKKSVELLTDREIDCLTWTSAGKTSAEIADILTLSEHTVNHYLNRAAKKLDTVNRTQAVAKALRAGIIR